MMQARMAVLLIALLVTGLVARGADPFTVTARLDQAAVGTRQVVVQVEVPPHHMLNADRLAVQVDGLAAAGHLTPAALPATDPAGAAENVYTSRVTGVYPLGNASGGRVVKVAVSLQGCSDTTCYLPRTATFTLGDAASPQPAAAADHTWLEGLRNPRAVAGYQSRAEFLAFLEPSAGAPQAERGLSGFARDPAAFLKRQGVLWTVLLVLLGGLLLNLTPCVLPMIPINLAIIGAGAHAQSRRHGFLLGTAYGAGMALAYGALGVAAVLTGGVFGALQGSPLFSGAMAVLFLLFGLALFGVVPIDLSRFQKRGAGDKWWLAAMVAGGISALLGGACVAPVVAAVLVLAGTLYHGGWSLAALLPLLLGVGMALPWPLAGAGLAVLPRPGAWMVRVKQLFALLILGLAASYGVLAYTGFRRPSPAGEAGSGEGNSLQAGDWDGWRRQVAVAQRDGQPLLIDFHASWCKACHLMDRTTFRDPGVQRVLKGYRVVRLAAEQPNEEPARGMLEAFGIAGLPTYVAADVSSPAAPPISRSAGAPAR